MTLQELKTAHAEIMGLIEKSNDGTASVTFRRFDNGDFMVDFHAENWYEWAGKKNTTIYTHSDASRATNLVALVAEFLKLETEK